MRMWPSGPPGVLAAEASSGGGGAAKPEPDLARTEPVTNLREHILTLQESKDSAVRGERRYKREQQLELISVELISVRIDHYKVHRISVV